MNTPNTPDLTDAEIDGICAGLTQNAAKVRFMQSLGLTVRQKPNGKPLVNRAHYDAVTGIAASAAQSNEPNWRVRA